jgi:hypothetical protein
MLEIGVDISKNRLKSTEKFGGKNFNYVVTVSDNVKESWSFFQEK